MKRYLVALALWALGVEARPVLQAPVSDRRGKSIAGTRAHQHHIRGFADVNPNDDASLKIIAEEARQRPSESNLVVHPQTHEKSPEEIQHEVERMVTRMKRLDDPKAEEQFAEELDGVEVALSKVGATRNPKLAKEINDLREDICAERGFKRHEKTQCERFMEQACSAFRDSSSRLPPQSKPNGGFHLASRTTKSHCDSFFRVSQAPADSDQEASDVTQAEVAAAQAHAPSGAMPGAPAGAPGAAAGPAAYPGPYFGTKADRPLPEHGFKPLVHQTFDGDLVQHTNMTQVDDWGEEFGPQAQHRSFYTICKEHPNNEWCRLHGYYDTLRAGAQHVGVQTSAMALAVMATLCTSFLWV